MERKENLRLKLDHLLPDFGKIRKISSEEIIECYEHNGRDLT